MAAMMIGLSIRQWETVGSRIWMRMKYDEYINLFRGCSDLLYTSCRPMTVFDAYVSLHIYRCSNWVDPEDTHESTL
jgi:hypothetical protein